MFFCGVQILAINNFWQKRNVYEMLEALDVDTE